MQIQEVNCIAKAVGQSIRIARPETGVGQKLPWFVVLSCLLALSGCGSKTSGVAHLQGNVTLSGKPVPADATAFIVFAPDKKGVDPVSIPIANGHYDAPNIPRGPLKVFIQITRPAGPLKKSERTGQSYQETVNLVPDKYATGIPLAVDGDDPNRDFQLTN